MSISLFKEKSWSAQVDYASDRILVVQWSERGNKVWLFFFRKAVGAERKHEGKAQRILKLTRGIFWPWLPKAIESAVVSGFARSQWYNRPSLSWFRCCMGQDEKTRRVDSDSSKMKVRNQVINTRHKMNKMSEWKKQHAANNLRPTWDTRKPLCRKNSKWLSKCLSKYRWNICMDFCCSILWYWRSGNKWAPPRVSIDDLRANVH